MSPKPQSPDQRVVFGISQEPGDALVFILQVPPGAWDYMKDGHSHTFDLHSLGLPIKLLLAGCKSRADGVRVLEEANKARGHATLHMPNHDFGIKDSASRP